MCSRSTARCEAEFFSLRLGTAELAHQRHTNHTVRYLKLRSAASTCVCEAFDGDSCHLGVVLVPIGLRRAHRCRKARRLA